MGCSLRETCNDCKWFVEETAAGDYQHEEAVKNKRGFCLKQDLYTMVEPTDKACEDFTDDGWKPGEDD